MWPVIWCRAISQAWKLHILCNSLSDLKLHSNFNPMDLHGQIACSFGARPCNFTSGWKILHLAHSLTLWLCCSSSFDSLFPDSDSDLSHACNLSHCFNFAHTHLLGIGVSIWTWKRWSSIIHFNFILSYCHIIWTLYQIFSSMSEK